MINLSNQIRFILKGLSDPGNFYEGLDLDPVWDGSDPKLVVVKGFVLLGPKQRKFR